MWSLRCGYYTIYLPAKKGVWRQFLPHSFVPSFCRALFLVWIWSQGHGDGLLFILAAAGGNLDSQLHRLTHRIVGELILQRLQLFAYRAIEQAIRDGKVRSAGISCYYIRELDAFLPQVDLKPVLVQNEVHPYYQDTPVVRHIQEADIPVQAWYPLGGRGYNRELMTDPVLRDIAAAHSNSLVQVILRWDL